MTLDYLKDQIKEIAERAKDGDDEVAHSKEDDIRGAVLLFVASPDCSSLEQAKELCREVLLTSDIDFARWCA